MMLVYKEDSTPTITAPTYPRLTVGDSNTKLGNLECCVSAVETINALATDMSVYVEEARILRKGIFCDYISLLQILAYYLYFPLRAAASDFNALSDHWPLDEVSNTGTNNERIPSIFSKLQARRKNFQACYTKLTRLIMVIENRLNNLPKLKTTNWSSPLDRLRRASLHNEKVGIPSTGPIEILFRMTALDSGASSIDSIEYRLKALCTSKVPNNSKCLPRVVAICTSKMPSIEDSTRLVITTSKENWYGFEAMNDFVKKARKSRYKHSAILEFSGDIEVIEVMSNKIMKLTKSGPSEVMCHGLSFDHSKVQAQILSLPGCAPKARCQRCQVLFRFSVTPSVLQLERYPGYASDSEEYIGTNTGMDCAECFAHFYCKAAFGTGTRIEKVDSPLH